MPKRHLPTRKLFIIGSDCALRLRHGILRRPLSNFDVIFDPQKPREGRKEVRLDFFLFPEVKVEWVTKGG